MSTRRKRIRLLIAHDKRLYREALRLLLESESGFEVVGDAADGQTAIALSRRVKPEVLLLDVAIAGVPRLEVLKAVGAGPAAVRVILLDSSMSRGDVLTALQHGARGIIVKDASRELLFKSIHAVIEDQYWIGREAISDLVALLRQISPVLSSRRPFNLTERELQIVEAVVDGQSNQQIAGDLGLVEHTVKHHLTSIYNKVGVSNRLELALFAMHHGLVPAGGNSEPVAIPDHDGPAAVREVRAARPRRAPKNAQRVRRRTRRASEDQRVR